MIFLTLQQADYSVGGEISLLRGRPRTGASGRQITKFNYGDMMPIA